MKKLMDHPLLATFITPCHHFSWSIFCWHHLSVTLSLLWLSLIYSIQCSFSSLFSARNFCWMLNLCHFFVVDMHFDVVVCLLISLMLSHVFWTISSTILINLIEYVVTYRHSCNFATTTHINFAAHIIYVQFCIPR
jgi:hypothetical protein